MQARRSRHRRASMDSPVAQRLEHRVANIAPNHVSRAAQGSSVEGQHAQHAGSAQHGPLSPSPLPSLARIRELQLVLDHPGSPSSSPQQQEGASVEQGVVLKDATLQESDGHTFLVVAEGGSTSAAAQPAVDPLDAAFETRWADAEKAAGKLAAAGARAVAHTAPRPHVSAQGGSSPAGDDPAGIDDFSQSLAEFGAAEATFAAALKSPQGGEQGRDGSSAAAPTDTDSSAVAAAPAAQQEERSLAAKQAALRAEHSAGAR